MISFISLTDSTTQSEILVNVDSIDGFGANQGTTIIHTPSFGVHVVETVQEVIDKMIMAVEAEGG